jgi:hypothetical protein
MAEFIRNLTKMPNRFGIATISDTHLGAVTCHEEALDGCIDFIARRKNMWWTFGGDVAEGKPIRSKHYDPTVLVKGLETIEAQAEHAKKKFKRIAKKCLAANIGNHDEYLKPDFDVFGRIWRELQIPVGGYQTWLTFGRQQKLRGHMFHGRRSIPRGAKDPIQKVGNQNAWLANELYPLAGDAHFQLMGHVHTAHVQGPIPEYALFCEGENVRARFVVPQESVWLDNKTGEEIHHVPKHARWYACMGTFRRSGFFGGIDYAERGGYPPSPISYQIVWIKDLRVEKIETIYP